MKQLRAISIICVSLAVLFASLPGCNCGSGGGHGIGSTCTNSNQCDPGLVCNPNGTCQSTNGDGGLPDGGDGGCVNLQCQQVSCSTGTTSLTGHVYDPSGTLPLYNAIVFVPNGATQPFSSGVSCDQCGVSVSGAPLVITLTGPDGAFTLNNVPVGSNIPLVFQIGKWRRQVTIPSVPACTNTPLTDVGQLRLPRSQAEGDLPQMAIATGKADPFECLLLKIGIDPAEFTLPTGTGRVHMYQATGGKTTNPPAPTADKLWSNLDTLKKYDVVLLPCEGDEYRKPVPASQNIVGYTSAGGRVFATHYSYVWLADGGPPFGYPPFPSTADWRPDPGQADNPPNPFNVNVDKSFPKGSAFEQWLGNVQALSGGQLPLRETRHNVWGVNPGTSRWLYGDLPNTHPSVQHLTFNTPFNPPLLPDGDAGVQCGRVVFSDFHVTTNALSSQPTFPDSCRMAQPFTAQEKALVFMLFDVSSCVQSDVTAPTVCRALGETCSASNTCCPGYSCADTSSGTACTASSTQCKCFGFR